MRSDKCGSDSALRRVWIAAVAIARSDAPVATMHEQLGFLIARDAASPINRVGLGVEHRGSPAAARPPNGPTIRVPNHVLIPSCHLALPFLHPW